MPRIARQESPSSVYHIVSRGAAHQIIFENDDDRAFFMTRLVETLDAYNAELFAWCLMDNHVHLLVRIAFENLPQAMHALFTGYAGYFNRVHGRTGPVFEGRYKSEAVTSEEYLMGVVRYIHFNPVKAGLSNGPHYPWNSYSDYIGRISTWTETKYVLDVFCGLESFKQFHIQEGITREYLDVYSAPKQKSSDKEALEKAQVLLGINVIGSIKAMPKVARNQALVKLKDEGLSLRQIQRITGVPLGTISRAGK